MEVESKKEKTSSIFKKLESYLSIKRHKKSSAAAAATAASDTNTSSMFTKSKSWDISSSKKDKKPTTKRHVAPSGFFFVYVGPEKQRFMIKMKYVNHPLFKMLLEDAEMEYGFSNEGPLLLPCEVDLFVKVLAEMDREKEFDDERSNHGFVYGSCSPFNPARRLGKSDMAKGSRSYGLLTPPRSLKINHL